MAYKYQKFSPQGVVETKSVFYSTQLILEAAEELGVNWRELPGTEVFELSYKGKVQHFYKQIPGTTTSQAQFMCEHKHITRNALRHAGISVVNGFTVRRQNTADYRTQVFAALEKPLAIKPSVGSQGSEVYLHIESYSEYEKLVEKITQERVSASVETMFTGQEYRILATPERVIGIIHRVPANVVGDGASSIQELIDQKNSDPRRGTGHQKALVKIRVDQHVERALKAEQLTLSSVLPKGKQVFLRKNSNLSTGGDSYDVTDQVHPSVLKLGCKIVQSIPGLALGGIDFMTKDISAAQVPGEYVVIEINHSPMLSMHDFPFVGKKRNAAQEFVYLHFPELR